MKCIRCDEISDYVFEGLSLCHKHCYEQIHGVEKT